jgi:hypothetical protein
LIVGQQVELEEHRPGAIQPGIAEAYARIHAVSASPMRRSALPCGEVAATVAAIASAALRGARAVGVASRHDRSTEEVLHS